MSERPVISRTALCGVSCVPCVTSDDPSRNEMGRVGEKGSAAATIENGFCLTYRPVRARRTVRLSIRIPVFSLTSRTISGSVMPGGMVPSGASSWSTSRPIPLPFADCRAAASRGAGVGGCRCRSVNEPGRLGRLLAGAWGRSLGLPPCGADRIATVQRAPAPRVLHPWRQGNRPHQAPRVPRPHLPAIS